MIAGVVAAAKKIAKIAAQASTNAQATAQAAILQAAAANVAAAQAAVALAAVVPAAAPKKAAAATPPTAKRSVSASDDGLDPDCLCPGETRCRMGSCWFYGGRVQLTRRRLEQLH